MSVQVALLRGINVGGHNPVAMPDLCEVCQNLGLSGVKSVLQSGNLVFTVDRVAGAELERLLEKETAKRLGVSVDYIIRSAAEWQEIAACNPFPKEAKDDPSHLVVMFLKTTPQVKKMDALRASIKGPELLVGEGKQLYIVYPAGIGRSKLTGTVIEQKLGSRGTARNWNTVQKLLALCK